MSWPQQMIRVAGSLLSIGVGFCFLSLSMPGSHSIGPQYNLVNIPIASAEPADNPANVARLKNAHDRLRKLNSDMEKQGW